MKIENERRFGSAAEAKVKSGNEARPGGTKGFPVLPLLCVLLLLLLGISVFRGVTGIRDMNARLQDALSEKEALESELDEVTAQEATTPTPKAEDSDVKSRNLGLSEDFLKQMLTWKSYEDYKNVRAWLFDNHTIDANGSLDVFMPNVDEATLGDANLAYRSAGVYVLHESEADISYLALCTVENKTNGNVGEGRVAVFYSIDANGTVHDVSAYALAR